MQPLNFPFDNCNMKLKIKSIHTIPLALVVMLSMVAFIDINNLDNYANQGKPAYILKDNTMPGNPISDKGATLGRVLFYDKQLSVNRTISCASCHKQEYAFGDTAVKSKGLNGGSTGRHSMRLVNSRFGDEIKFFWDERAASLEDQSSQPIQDHIEMGFSGTQGDPDLDSLIRRMNQLDYYPKLFKWVFGDANITETRIQRALAQFVRSIQSFDSKYDLGRAQVLNEGQPFPNFTPQENQGKQLFLAPVGAGGAGCQGCHRAPEFDIDPASRNNGVVVNPGGGFDFTVTRSPTLRNVFNPSKILNGPLMHTGSFNSMLAVLSHYNNIPLVSGNNNLDPRLAPGGVPQNLGLTTPQVDAITAFIQTLTGNDIYTNPKWSNPFDANGNLSLIGFNTGIANAEKLEAKCYPNPATSVVNFDLPHGDYSLIVFSASGQKVLEKEVKTNGNLNIEDFRTGVYFFEFMNEKGEVVARKQVIKK